VVCAHTYALHLSISPHYRGYLVVISWLSRGYLVVLSWFYRGYILVISWLYRGQINISCPNTEDGMPFEEPDALYALLSSVQRLSLQEPVFLKCSADLTATQADALTDTAAKFEFVKGLIFCNLTKDRASPLFDRGEIETLAMKGGISGRAVGPKSLWLLSHTFRRHGRRFVLVGCGGIFTAEDAYARIKAGASLIQVRVRVRVRVHARVLSIARTLALCV
jgi:dihydroorotate dehydrogenase